MRTYFDNANKRAAIGFALLAVASIGLSLLGAPVQVRAPVVFLAVLLGPAVLVWRLVTPRPWAECLLVGAAIDVSLVMLVSLIMVGLGTWHPLRVEQVFPALTCVGAWYLFRRVADADAVSEHDQ